MRTAVLCRTNAPLIICAFDLIKCGVRVQIVGKDVARKLKETIGEVLEHRRNVPIGEFIDLVEGWIDDIRTRFMGKRSKETYVVECEDYAGCLLVMSEHCRDAKGLFTLIDEFFVDEENVGNGDVVTLLTTHKAKGLEYDQVIIIRPDLMPHPAAELEADKKQEANLEYVALTRAKECLIIVEDTQPV